MPVISDLMALPQRDCTPDSIRNQQPKLSQDSAGTTPAPLSHPAQPGLKILEHHSLWKRNPSHVTLLKTSRAGLLIGNCSLTRKEMIMIRPELLKDVLKALSSHLYLELEDFNVNEFINKDQEPCLSIKYRANNRFFFDFHILKRGSSLLPLPISSTHSSVPLALAENRLTNLWL
jgi:hypothetical protein